LHRDFEIDAGTDTPFQQWGGSVERITGLGKAHGPIVREEDRVKGTGVRSDRSGGAGALALLPDPMLYGQHERLVWLATKDRRPTIYAFREPVEAGGLISDGPSQRDNRRRAAAYVDRILKGAKPGSLSIESPTKFELVINLKTANALGITIPESVRARADHAFK
jgi:putative ABC transport system substrate-binding protein